MDVSDLEGQIQSQLYFESLYPERKQSCAICSF